MKIGILGGTFDPIHLGHLAVAAETCRCLKLDRLVFLPAGQPYFKQLNTITPAEQRLEMLELAIRGEPLYSISKLEIERQGPSYAVDSVSRMKASLTLDAELFFIMGWDSLLSLPLWYEAPRLIQLCKIVASPRPGFPKPDISQIEAKLPGITQRSIVLERPLIDISSTDIRRRVALGQPISDKVPPAVEKYILKNGLYLEKTPNSKLRTPN
jgi:nicotinate-nucleotide adenylyltransferase